MEIGSCKNKGVFLYTYVIIFLIHIFKWKRKVTWKKLCILIYRTGKRIRSRYWQLKKLYILFYRVDFVIWVLFYGNMKNLNQNEKMQKLNTKLK